MKGTSRTAICCCSGSMVSGTAFVRSAARRSARLRVKAVIQLCSLMTRIGTPTEMLGTPTDVLGTPTDVLGTPTDMLGTSTDMLGMRGHGGGGG